MKVFAFWSYYLLVFLGAGMACYLGLKAGSDKPAWAFGYVLLVLLVATVMHLVGVNTMHRIFEGRDEDNKVVEEKP
jgi:uncharacterized membrane protein YccC